MKYLALAFLLAATPVCAAPPAVKDTSYREANGQRVQQVEVVVPVPPAKVWDAFMTDAGFTGWAAPVGHVTPGNDGMMEATYSLSGKIGDPNNIRNQIVAYLPGRMLAIHNVNVPRGAPFKKEFIEQIRTVVLFDDLGNGSTRVTISGVGYGEGAGFDEMYAHFSAGNAEELASLVTYLTKGPVDWKAAAAAANASVGAKQ